MYVCLVMLKMRLHILLRIPMSKFLTKDVFALQHFLTTICHNVIRVSNFIMFAPVLREFLN